MTLKGRLGDTLDARGRRPEQGDDHTKSRIRVTLQGIKGPFQGFEVARTARSSASS